MPGLQTTPSTAIVTDIATLQTSGYTSESVAKSAATRVDIVNLAAIARENLAECQKALLQLQANLDSADPQLALVTSILATLA